MNDFAERWIRVSRESPCPICDKPDNCSVSTDGVLVWCGRIAEGSLKQNDGGQYLHRLRDTFTSYLRPQRPKRVSAGRDYCGLAQRLFDDGATGRTELARLLGVSVSSLERLEVGWNRWEEYWSFPERDAQGKVIGISSRLRNGEKKRLPGGKSGLTYAVDWNTGVGPILLVEGGSDTAALLTMGINVIGRPSNLGGVALLGQLLERVSPQREIVVVGERDQKESGLWPGRDGAIQTATGLAAKLNREISWSLAPDGAKDSRAWLQHFPGVPSSRLADLFLSGLDVQVIDPPRIYATAIPAANGVELENWREQMLRMHLQSLRHPGSYLDTSSTGAGKSYVDFATVLNILSREAAWSPY